jgi:hypothetical protein
MRRIWAASVLIGIEPKSAQADLARHISAPAAIIRDASGGAMCRLEPPR